ncbi:ThiF family adenylyltransferase [Kribbella speibonae]|uniref:ThiF family adenylyltransferase n=1 Tax=Kribbella speibonae TaxID=1572660 RepID=A0A4R0IZH0_9ACTN|nr:ThiF family adenylyltransferase [Kribbella speibonae]TCC38889.1 ThiF family adenylyltransferase [Kribbella speibonae]
MSTRIAFTEDQFKPLVAALGNGDETAMVVATSLVGAATTAADSAKAGGHVTLLAQVITQVPKGAYLERGPRGLSISSAGWVPAFRAAVAKGQVPVFVHTHPGGLPEFSQYDDQVDCDLAVAARAFGAPYYAAIVISGTPDHPGVAARLYDLGDTFTPIAPDHTVVDAVRVTGSGLRLYLPTGSTNQHGTIESGEEKVSAFDRQIRMLGQDGDRSLKQVRAAIVGAGGTGSAVGAQIARLGLGEIIVVDDDIVTEPTPTRGHGMTAADLNLPKAEVLGDHLNAIGLGTKITKINKPLHDPDAIAAIAHADVIFSCVDGHGARLILNRWAYAHIAPVIDVAVLITPVETADSNRKVEIEQRVTWVAPGAACLLCRGRVDATLAYAENLDPETRKRLAGEGYVQAAETPRPAVVTLTTSVAALGATEFLLRLTGLGPVDATEMLLRSHLGELRRNARPPRPGCFCTSADFTGRGTRTPYLDLVGAWS